MLCELFSITKETVKIPSNEKAQVFQNGFEPLYLETGNEKNSKIIKQKCLQIVTCKSIFAETYLAATLVQPN